MLSFLFGDKVIKTITIKKKIVETPKKNYNEEEVLKLLIKFSDDRTFIKKNTVIHWFELNKK